MRILAGIGALAIIMAVGAAVFFFGGFFNGPFQIRSATGQHRRHGGVSGGGKGRGQGL